MKVVKLPAVRRLANRVKGAVIVDGNHVFMEAGMHDSADVVVNLTTGTISHVGLCRDDSDVAYPNAELLLDGVQPVPVPPFKSAEQHAQEFLKWGYDNPNKSQFSNITIYTPGEVIEGRTNANIRRQWHTWLAARGV